MVLKSLFSPLFILITLCIFIPQGITGPPTLLAGAAALPITPADAKGEIWKEPYHDQNENGRYDAPNPSNPNQPHDSFADLNQNGKWDGPFLAGFNHVGPYYTATGTHDPIWSRVLILQMGETKLALVALDLVGYFYPHVQAIREAVKDLGFTQVIVASTHTHGGPDSIGLWGPNRLTDGKDPRFMAHIQNQTVKALREAHAKLQPAKLRFAKTTVPVDFGHLISDFRDPIVIDEEILVMQVTKTNGETIATVVNWSPHPETMGGTSSLITSDFPHYLREGIERGGFKVRGRLVRGVGGIGIYFSRAVGGLLTTLEVNVKDEEGNILPQRSWAKTQRIGELAAAAVLEALRNQPFTPLSSLRVSFKELYLSLDNLLFRQLAARGVLQRKTYTGGIEKENGEDILTEVGLVSFNGPATTLAQMVTVPGELFPEILVGGFLSDSKDCWSYTQRKRALDGRGKERLAAAHPEIPPEPILQERMRGEFRFLIGLGNDELGYIVPANDFVPPIYTPRPRYGKDRCGDRDHYEESVSASSQMAPYVTGALMELIERGSIPKERP